MANKKALRGPQLAAAIQFAIAKANSAGLTVEEKCPGGQQVELLKAADINITHLVLIGGARIVNFYPTTGAVYANVQLPDFPSCARGKGIVEAIRIAKEGK